MIYPIYTLLQKIPALLTQDSIAKGINSLLDTVNVETPMAE